MSSMLELFLRPPDAEREAALVAFAAERGAQMTYREAAGMDAGSVCLTFECASLERAEALADGWRQSGEHVEGPCDYGELVPADA